MLHVRTLGSETGRDDNAVSAAVQLPIIMSAAIDYVGTNIYSWQSYDDSEILLIL